MGKDIEINVSTLVLIIIIIGISVYYYSNPIVKTVEIEVEVEKDCYECPVCEEPVNPQLTIDDVKDIVDDNIEIKNRVYSGDALKILEKKALLLLKNSECFKNSDFINRTYINEKYDVMLSVSKSVNIIYDNDKKFFGFMVLELKQIANQLDSVDIEYEVDVETGIVNCDNNDIFFNYDIVTLKT